MTIGAVCGGRLMKLGRRFGVLVAIPIGLSGITITMWRNFPCLMIGRFIFGFSTGLFSAICPRYIEEVIPAHLHANILPSFCTAQCLGNVTAYALGAILPDDTDKEALIETQKWRIIYFYFPGAMYIVAFVGFWVLLPYESIGFCATHDRDSEAKKAIA